MFKKRLKLTLKLIIQQQPLFFCLLLVLVELDKLILSPRDVNTFYS
jgi:hypothetical protein